MRTALEKLDSGTKIQKAYEVLVMVVVSCEIILPSGAKKKIGHHQCVFAKPNAMKTHRTQMSKEDPVQEPGAQMFFQLQSSA